jgi:drug/metabolite transporter (DMT)-like permease
VLAFASAVVFGVQYVVLDKASLDNVDAAVLTQFVTATLVIGLLGLMTRSLGGVTRSDFPRLIGIGLIFGAGGLCLSASMVATNVAVASAVLMAEPIVLALLGYFVNRERLSTTQVVALLVVVAGAVTATVAS